MNTSNTHPSPEQDKGIQQLSSGTLKTTFVITQWILVAAALICFFGAVQSKDPKMRLVLSLEGIISAVASYYYTLFVTYLDNKQRITAAQLSEIRYSDWYITTPIMLIALTILMGADFSKTAHLVTIAVVLLLDYVMLHYGYLGEMGKLNKWTACIYAFLPFFIMFALIHYTFIKSNFSAKKEILFWGFFLLWAHYGTVYLLDDVSKNMFLNMFDAFAKGGMGVSLYANLI
jgi:bacteriorhodopsin